MVKVVTLFLIVVGVLAMFGKLGWLGSLDPRRLGGKRPPGLAKPAICIDVDADHVSVVGADGSAVIAGLFK